ncbi:MAG: hypothetical protein RLZZ597_2808 [Cyanobacteriota bacterium]|jgi:hypothetical protein
MKLTYRGVSYDYTPNPMPKMGETFETGTYRGARVAFRAVAEPPAQPAADLTWRGVPYHTGTMTPVAVAEPALAQPAMATPVAVAMATNGSNSVPELARNLFIRRHQRSRKREQGMMVRLAAEVGLPLDEAMRYESHIQGKTPHDFAAYDRSSIAMS